MGRYKMSNVAISMNGVVKSWVGFSLATNEKVLAKCGLNLNESSSSDQS